MSWATDFPGFRLKLTRWGGIFLITVAVLILAAANTGNNALVMLVGLSLGCYVTSGIWSRQVLARTRVRVRPPREAYAGHPFAVEVELINTSGMLPAYGLVLRDDSGHLLHLEPLLAAGEHRRCTVEVTCNERGWNRLGPWRIEVLLPLGFFVKSKEVVRKARVLVYPRLAATAGTMRGHHGEHITEALSARGREGEVTQLREFREGDELRQIHWKQTARQDRLVIVERQRRARRSSYVVVEPRVAMPDDPRVRAWFEQVVSRAATAVVQRLRRSEPVGLILGGEVIQPIDRPSQAGLLLRHLALVQLQPLLADPGATTEVVS
jgi:uncharacterized protein (DUF58 family)